MWGYTTTIELMACVTSFVVKRVFVGLEQMESGAWLRDIWWSSIICFCWHQLG